ncbi:MAG TPA: hypothetical protein VFE60_09215 [Roseiarcus sp.]|jgi:hypothetical protein|nr:hypothetical protein [Roseiarcus sp.]
MQPATQIAKSILHLKTPRARAFASGMGRNHRGPYDPLTCAKVSDACRFIKSLSAEARRYYLAERKAKWLTNCIVTHPDRKTFDLAGVLDEPYDIHIEMPLDATLLDFLLLVMNCPDAPMLMRLDAAKTAATLMHERPKPVVTVEREQQLERRRERKRQYMRRRYRERLSAVAAAIPANPPVAEG